MYDFGNAEYEDEYGTTAGMYENKSDDDVIGDVYASYKGSEPSVSVPAGVDKIGNRAFYKNGTIQSISLPSSVYDIGEFAFARSALSDISLPNGLKYIDYAAFYNCPNLANISIPESVGYIALGAFDGTPYLENWKSSDDPNDFLIVGDSVLLAYKGNDKKVTVPDGVRHIGAGAFSGKNMESVTIPGSVADIGEEAFSDCNNLKELVMDEGLRQISDRAFKNSDLSIVNIPDSVESIGLSAFDNGGKLKTVIFMGDNVPNVTYDKSATRLSARSLRTNAFEGAENAIVGTNCNLDDGTMFNPKFYGFSGEVYSIDPKQDKTLVLERVITKPDVSGNVLVNQSVNIAGDTYTLDQVKSDAFDFYKNWSDYFENRPTNIAVNGERSDALDSLLATVNASLPAGSAADDTQAEAAESAVPDNIRSNITVGVNGSRFPTTGSAYANIPGVDDKLTLNVSEDDSASSAIESAFRHSTGSVPGNYVPLSVDMYDKSGTVPIHKLGNSKMEVSLPLPAGMENDEGIGIACLDDNGALEQLSSEVTDTGSGKNIKFVTGHCSTYVIYSRGRVITSVDENGNPVETVDETNAAGMLSMNGTWQSLNKKVYGPVSAKWFIIIILIALAGILVLYKPGKNNKNTGR